MSKWNFNIEVVGNKLHTIIRESDDSISGCSKVIESSLECLKYIQDFLPEDTYCYYFQNIWEDTRYLVDLFQDESLSYDYAEYAVNKVLDRFYDRCDELCIWLGV